MAQTRVSGQDLFIAVKQQKYELVERYLKAGFRGAYEDENGHSVFHAAAGNDDAKMIALLLKYNLQPILINNNKNTAIEEAYNNKKREAVKALSQYFDHDGKAHHSGVFLSIVRDGDYLLAELLLLAGAKFDWHKKGTENGAMHLAVLRKDKRMVELLHYYDHQSQSCVYKNKEKLTALTLASKEGFWEAADILTSDSKYKYSVAELYKSLQETNLPSHFYDAYNKKETKRALIEYIKTLPIEEQRTALANAKNPDHPLGKLIHLPRWLTTNKNSGTLKLISKVEGEIGNGVNITEPKVVQPILSELSIVELWGQHIILHERLDLVSAKECIDEILKREPGNRDAKCVAAIYEAIMLQLKNKQFEGVKALQKVITEYRDIISQFAYLHHMLPEMIEADKNKQEVATAPLLDLDIPPNNLPERQVPLTTTEPQITISPFNQTEIFKILNRNTIAMPQRQMPYFSEDTQQATDERIHITEFPAIHAAMGTTNIVPKPSVVVAQKDPEKEIKKDAPQVNVTKAVAEDTPKINPPATIPSVTTTTVFTKPPTSMELLAKAPSVPDYQFGEEKQQENTNTSRVGMKMKATST